MKFNILLILCMYSIKYSEEILPFKDCGSTDFTGVSDPKALGTNSEVSADTDIAYMLEDPVTCCGVINGWKAYVRHKGTIHFDIWRPTGGANFQLVGTYELTTDESDTQVQMQFHVPSDKYTVYPGDYIGWFTPSFEMVAGINSASEAKGVKFFKLRPSSHPLGEGLSWLQAVSQSSKKYAIKAEYGTNQPPYFVNLDAQIQIVPHVSIGTVLYTINATDPDISDTTITQLTYIMTSLSGLFSFDPKTRQVRVIADVPTSFGQQCLTFEVQDICQHKDTNSLCIFTDNVPPTVTCEPKRATIIETTTGNVVLTTVAVSDPTDDVTCSLRQTNDSSHFQLIGDNFEYKIYVAANPGFRVNTQYLYSVTVKCSDTKDITISTCEIEILPSAPPMFTNLPSILPLSTGNVKTDVVYAVSVTDPDSTSFNFSMTCKPSRCPFTLYNTGYIQLTQDIIELNASGYELNITVTDGYNSITSFLTVIISGANVYPKFTNLPANLTVEENSPRGLSLYTVTATDNNRDTLTYSMKSSPGSGMNYFSIDRASGLISTSTMRSIDFEATEKMFVFTVTVTDGILFVSESLTMNVTNVNEGLSFSQNTYRIVANESMANTTLPDPKFIVYDVDDGDKHTFKQDCLANNGYFTMNDTTGILTFAVDYDLDVPGKQRLIICIVTATDRGGLTDTATLSITLNEINDNTPTFKDLSYKCKVYSDSALGLVIGRISATDADIGMNGQIVYSTNPADNYFDVSSTGDITLQRYPQRTNCVFNVYATDAGSPARTGTTTVTVDILQPTTTTSRTTTTGYKTFIEDKRNIVWIVFLSLLAFLTTLLTVWLCWTSIRNWPIGFDPFDECFRNCSRPRWCKDCGQARGKGSDIPRPGFNRPQQPQPVNSMKRLSVTPRQQPVTPQQPSVTPQQLSVTPTHRSVTPQISPDITLPFKPSQASQSPMRPEDDPNFQGYNFWRKQWYGRDEMVI